MQCVKTGGHVFVHEYQQWVYGDIHQTFQGQFLVRVCEISRKPINNLSVVHMVVYEIDEWFDKNKTSGDYNSTLIAKVSGPLSYEGDEL